MTAQLSQSVFDQIISAPRFPNATRIKKSRSEVNDEKKRFLFIAYFNPDGISTVIENIAGWIEGSRFQYDILNVFYGVYPDGITLPESLDISVYDGLVIHCAVAYDPTTLTSLDRHIPLKIHAFEGVKVLMKQDEHIRPLETANAIRDLGIDIVLTVATPEIQSRMYPRETIGHEVRFIQVHTGYVGASLKSIPAGLSNRDVDIGYRGSVQPWSFGRLAYEKRDIGDRAIWHLKNSSLKTDISSAYGKRILREDWLLFLRRCKAVLGVESGASVVDFYGDVARRLKDFNKDFPDRTYFDAYESFLHIYERNCMYTALAPRHLEAAAARAVQIMYEGEFSGVLKPDVHYIRLERDHSNFKDCWERANDLEIRKRITDAAYEVIIENPSFDFATFLAAFDVAAGEALSSPRVAGTHVKSLPAK